MLLEGEIRKIIREELSLIYESKKMPEYQYHSTSWDRVDSILKNGLLLPKTTSDIATHAYNTRTISTADKEKFAMVYNPNGALLKLKINPKNYKDVDINSSWKPRENLEQLMNRLIEKYKSKGFDGIYVGDNYQSTVGNQTFYDIPPSNIELIN